MPLLSMNHLTILSLANILLFATSPLPCNSLPACTCSERTNLGLFSARSGNANNKDHPRVSYLIYSRRRNLTEADLTKDFVRRELLPSRSFLTLMKSLNESPAAIDDGSLFYVDMGIPKYNYGQWFHNLLKDPSLPKIDNAIRLVKLIRAKGLHRSRTMRRIIHQLMLEDFLEKFQAKCEQIRKEARQFDCPPTWDGLKCWPGAHDGQIIYSTCPLWVEGYDYFQTVTIRCSKKDGFAYRADYSLCRKLPVFASLHSKYSN